MAIYSRDHAPTSIIIFCLLIVVGIMVWPKKEDRGFPTLEQWMLSRFPFYEDKIWGNEWVMLEHACDVSRIFPQKQQAQIGINLPVRIAISIVVAQKILLSMFFITSNLHFFPRSNFYHQFSNHKCSNAWTRYFTDHSEPLTKAKKIHKKAKKEDKTPNQNKTWRGWSTRERSSGDWEGNKASKEAKACWHSAGGILRIKSIAASMATSSFKPRSIPILNSNW
jgi:hypothetical protein